MICKVHCSQHDNKDALLTAEIPDIALLLKKTMYEVLLRVDGWYEKYFSLGVTSSVRSTGEGKHVTICIKSTFQLIFQKLGPGNSQQSLLFRKILV